MSNYTFLKDVTEQIADIPPDSIISRTIFSDEQTKAILFGFAAGQELSEHTASMPAILHFVQGEAELTLGDDVMTAQSGTWVHMPAHLPHSVKAKTSVIMALLLLKK
ncbi:MAG: cupin domain-containing protein [Chloroflexi bacterium]|nr:cupin domain-containing protein [Chloroflexota bacterium]